MKQIVNSRQKDLAAEPLRENNQTVRGQVLKFALEILVRSMAKIRLVIAPYFKRRQQNKVVFRHLLALDSRTLRDIGLDRPREIAFPDSR